MIYFKKNIHTSILYIYIEFIKIQKVQNQLLQT